MPVVKLRFLSLVVATCRVIGEAIRQAGPMLLLPIGLVMLMQLIEPDLSIGDRPYSIPDLLFNAGVLLAGWIMTLVVTRASLANRSGLDLLRPDRLALMLLGLQAAVMIVTNLIPAPHSLGLQALGNITGLIFQITWTRATLLLGVAWALGVEMTPASSWRGLKGNFLRILGFGFVWALLLMVGVLAYIYSVNGSLRLPFPTVRPMVWAIVFGLISVLTTAIPCAIYRELRGLPSLPPVEPEPLAA